MKPHKKKKKKTPPPHPTTPKTPKKKKKKNPPPPTHKKKSLLQRQAAKNVVPTPEISLQKQKWRRRHPKGSGSPHTTPGQRTPLENFN